MPGAGEFLLCLAAGLIISVVTTPVGVSGAVFLLPVQLSVLGVPNPAVTPTNLLFNVVSGPGALLRYRDADGDGGPGRARVDVRDVRRGGDRLRGARADRSPARPPCACSDRTTPAARVRGVPASDYVLNLRAKVGHELIMFPTVSAVVLNDRGEILLGQRSDNHEWSVIAGMMDPGEQPADALVREVREETGVQVRIERLAGVALHEVVYGNGDRCHMVNTWFRCRAVGGEARVNDAESIAVGWFAPDALPALNPFALVRIRTSLEEHAPAWFAQPGDDLITGI